MEKGFIPQRSKLMNYSSLYYFVDAPAPPPLRSISIEKEKRQENLEEAPDPKRDWTWPFLKSQIFPPILNQACILCTSSSQSYFVSFRSDRYNTHNSDTSIMPISVQFSPPPRSHVKTKARRKKIKKKIRIGY